MNKEQALAVFENYDIWQAYYEKTATWFFSVMDIVAVVIQQPDHQTAREYWKQDDSIKINAEQMFKAMLPHTEVKTI